MSGQCESYQGGIFSINGEHWFTRQRFLVSDVTAVFLASFLGVVITLASTRLWILYSTLLRSVSKRFLRAQPSTAPGPPNQSIALISRPGTSGTPHIERTRVVEDIERIREESNSDLGFSFHLFANILKLSKSFRSNWREIVVKLGLALCILALFALATLGGILSANVVLDPVAFCHSPHCGSWGAIHGLGTGSISTVLRISKEKQIAAASQAAKCYRDSSPNNECNNLISRTISYTRDLSAGCPLNGDVCLSPAFRLDTGFQNAMVLGISSTDKFLFRRSTTCAPISVDKTYVKSSTDAVGQKTWKYYYGRQGDLNHTFETPRQRFSPGHPSYFVRSTTNTKLEGFVPLPMFDSSLGKVTLISILPSSVLYLERSDDLIFHATKRFNDNDTEIWTRSGEVAGTLACVDEQKVCFRDQQHCWSSMLDAAEWINANLADNVEANRNNILLFSALEFSTIHAQLIDYDAQALQVLSQLSHSGLSMATGDWRLESEGFFQSSLAWLQNEVVNIASGAFHDVPFTHNLFDAFQPSGFEWSGICKMVLVTAPDVKSVSLQGVLSILLLSLCIAIISVNPEDELVVLQFLKHAALMVITLVVKLASLTSKLFRQTWAWFQGRKRIRLPPDTP